MPAMLYSTGSSAVMFLWIHRECLSAAKFDLRGNPEGIETVTAYINACIQRLKSNPIAFYELRQPPVFSMPDGMLAQTDEKRRIKLIG